MSSYDETISAKSLRARTASASTTPTPLDASPIALYKGVVIKNLDETIRIYVGASNVSATDGYALEGGEESPMIEVDNAADIYIVAASGTPSYTWIGL